MRTAISQRCIHQILASQGIRRKRRAMYWVKRVRRTFGKDPMYGKHLSLIEPLSALPSRGTPASMLPICMRSPSSYKLPCLRLRGVLSPTSGSLTTLLGLAFSILQVLRRGRTHKCADHRPSFRSLRKVHFWYMLHVHMIATLWKSSQTSNICRPYRELDIRICSPTLPVQVSPITHRELIYTLQSFSLHCSVPIPLSPLLSPL